MSATKQDTLTVTQLKAAVRYESESGKFFRVGNRTRSPHGRVLGNKTSNGYLHISVNGKKYAAHRLAWLYAHGEWPNGDIDHIDGDRANNSLSNLRVVSRSTNLENLRVAKTHNASTGLLGAYPYGTSGKLFIAKIQVRGRTVRVGLFSTAQDAHEAYVRAKRELHGGCTI